MKTSSCPFHRECQFHNSTIKTPSDAMLHQFFCYMQYEECEIAQRILAVSLPVPARARPGGHYADITISSVEQSRARNRYALTARVCFPFC